MRRTFEFVKIVRAVDGDTFDVSIDLGFHTTHLTRIRIFGYFAEELKSKDPEKAKIAQEQWNQAKKLEGKTCVLIVHRQEKYGRWESDMIIDGIYYGHKTLRQMT